MLALKKYRGKENPVVMKKLINANFAIDILVASHRSLCHVLGRTKTRHHLNSPWCCIAITLKPNLAFCTG